MKITTIFNVRLGFILTFFLITQFLSSQDVFTTDSIAARIERQVNTFPQEKLYVHNDKPLYISGEKIWFRAHLVDSYSHKSDSTSIYVYGELINPLDSIVNRVKIRRDNDLYAGQFVLLEDYPAGTYTMRFYTKFMENLGDDYFFKKNIEIGGPFSSKYKTDAQYTYTNNNKKIEITLQFTDQKTNEKISPTNIAIGYLKEHLRGFSKEYLKKMKLDVDQQTSFDINIGKTPIKSIYVEYEYDGDFHCEFIPINAPKDDFHVDFLPEGGNLLNGVQMNMAFKALSSDGLSAAINGVVCTELGDTITSFNTVHKGMGIFPFFAKTGQKYVAICNTEGGTTKKFNLPQAVDSGYGLSVKSTPEQVYISLLMANNTSVADDLVLLIQSKGRVIYANSWAKDSQTIQLERAQLPAGVIHCLLVNKDYTPISERLFFNYPTNYAPQISLTNNKQTYLKRDEVVSKLTFLDNEGQPLTGNFSVSVTDNRDVAVDSTQNILTTLLLTSELKGYIEDPAFYFQKKRLASYALDVLMQTQGWRKYDMAKVLKGDIQKPTSVLEYCQMIEGEVKSGILLNRKGKGIPLVLMALSNPPYIQSEVSDENGRFMFRTDLPDSLTVTIKATTKGGGDRIDLKLEKENFPALLNSVPKYVIEKKQFNSYFEKADLKYTTEAGMRMINLKDVEVVATDVRKKMERSKYSSAINTVYDSEKFQRLGARTLRDVLNRIGGVRVEREMVYVRANTAPALIYVDDMEHADFLSFDPDVSELESVEVVKDAASTLFGARGANGAILIMTKRGGGNIPIPPLNVKKIRPLGYQSTAKFYSPKYETATQKYALSADLRTTLYWDPYVKVVDGKAEVSFYTADDVSTYTILLEGLTNEGKPLHLIEKIGSEK